MSTNQIGRSKHKQTFKRTAALVFFFLLAALASGFLFACSGENGANEEKGPADEKKEGEPAGQALAEIIPELAYQDVGELARHMPELKNGALIFTFDDGMITDYQVVKPILEEKGLSAVTYVAPGFVNTPGFMNWDQIKSLHESGWDIECHSYSHANLKEKTEADIKAEMENVNEAFAEQGLEAPKHHALPFGEYDETALEMVLSYRETVRTADSQRNEYPPNHRVLHAIDMSTHSTEVLEEHIDRAIKENSLLILFTHDVEAEPFDYGITTDKFKAVLDHALKQGIDITTLSELFGD